MYRTVVRRVLTSYFLFLTVLYCQLSTARPFCFPLARHCGETKPRREPAGSPLPSSGLPFQMQAFETTMRGKLLFSPHPFAQANAYFAASPRPERKLFEKSFLSGLSFKNFYARRPLGGFNQKRALPLNQILTSNL